MVHRRVRIDAACVRPDVRIGSPSPHWVSLADYQAGILSVGYTVSNHEETDVTVYIPNGWITATNGVAPCFFMGCETMATFVNGSVPARQSVEFTARFKVLTGVGSFRTDFNGTVTNICGTTYQYGV